jgi:threonyl-tRNA synthetase
MLHTMAHSETRLANFVHCKTDFGTDPINSDKLRFHEHATRSVSRAGAKIAEAEKAKVHTMLVIGGRDPAVAGPATFPSRLHGKGNIGAKPKGEVVADILAAIRERRA